MKRLPFTLVATAVALLLSACTSQLRVSVTRFHQLSPSPNQTFIVVAADETNDKSLEFQQYANAAVLALQALGFAPASGPNPDLIVKLDYGVSPPREKVRRESGYGSFYGDLYFGHWPYWGPYWFYPHSFSRFGYGFSYYPYEYSYTVFDMSVNVAIEKNGGPVIFEGRAVATTRKGNLTTVVPTLIHALFTNFPGRSGETITIKVPFEEKGGGY